MAATYTQKDIKSITSRFTMELQRAGSLKKNQEIHYTSGSNGVSATLEVKTVEGDDCTCNTCTWTFQRVSWLPRFTPKDTKRTQYKMIAAATEILWAVNRSVTVGK